MVSAAAEYDVFAPHYDAFTAGSDYERWTSLVLEHLSGHGLRGERLLDLACGTGKSFVPFRERGFRVAGCDLSPAMLAEAALKAPDAQLAVADLRELPVFGSFDLVTCFDDSLNYLPDEEALGAALAGAAANLAPDGLLAFDLNTLLAYRTTFARDSVGERDGRLFAWRGESSAVAEPGCEASARIDVFAPLGDDSYARVTSAHRQRHFTREQVTARLACAGLELVCVSGVLEDGTLVPEADELRLLKLLYTARHAKGGAPE